MGIQHYKHLLQRILNQADIWIDGARPWDIRIHNPEFYRRILTGGSLAVGESYMDGWWDCDQLGECFARVLRMGLDDRFRNMTHRLAGLKGRLLNLQRASRAFQVGRRHYDLGNRLYRAMLDRRMIYSCAYWREAGDLDQAQEAKLDLVCRKLALEPGMRVLDIGCGWGGAARFAAERYGVEVVGLTISREQAGLARQNCRGLPVEIRLQDYRELDEHFDRIFSIGMFEHVGHRNYRRYMCTVRRCLDDEGLFLLHTIGGNESLHSTDPWIERYIFPNSMLPSARQISQAFEGLFVLEDWHGFGPDYDRTLMQWYANFEAAWDELRQDYDERFHRMWRYYLLVSAGSFRARVNQVWQILLSPKGVPGGMLSQR